MLSNFSVDEWNSASRIPLPIEIYRKFDGRLSSASRSGGREGDFDSKRVVAAKKAIACPSQGDS